MSTKTISLEILNQTFQINVPNSEVESLNKAANYLNEKISLVEKNPNNLKGSDGLLIIAALTISDELLKLKAETSDTKKMLKENLNLLRQKLAEFDKNQEVMPA